MAERRFKLPGEEELNKDQDRVLALPEDGQYLVVGGPGTGKSVVALLRALKFQDNKDYIFLVYNHVLESATCQLINTDLKGTTLVKLFYKLYWHLFKEFVPQIEAHKPDYDLIIKKITELNNYSERSQHLIIDEGQDMPLKYYEVLQYAGYTHFFIVADQNQQITEDNSSRTELTNLLGLEVKDVLELKINYRNSNHIAIFANHFFTDKSSPAPDLPEKDSLDTPVFYKGKSLDDYIEMILREADKDNRNLIGVVVANNNMRKRYYDKLNSLEITLDHSKPIISSYSSSDKQNVNINFSQGGIVVLNDKSIKGLEFDVVYIVLDGFRIYNNDKTSMKKRLYVMSSRAIKKLVLVSTQREPGIISLLPEDEMIMRIIDDVKKPEPVTAFSPF